MLLYYNGVTQCAPGVFAAFLWRRATALGVGAGIVVGLLVAIPLAALSLNPWGINAGLIGLGANVVVLVLVSLVPEGRHPPAGKRRPMSAEIARPDLAVSAADTKLLMEHYALVGPIIERLFGGIPLVWTTMPQGAGGPRTYHGPLSVHTNPKAPIVNVQLHGVVERYPKLSADRILGLTRHGGVEFHSWSPTPDDPTRVRFARLLIETEHTERSRLYEAIRIMQTLIHDEDNFMGPLSSTAAPVPRCIFHLLTLRRTKTSARGCAPAAKRRSSNILMLSRSNPTRIPGRRRIST